MSLVGPRPERPVFVSQFNEEVPGYADRHAVAPGITGWAQLNDLRQDTLIEQRTTLSDLRQLLEGRGKNRCLWNRQRLIEFRHRAVEQGVGRLRGAESKGAISVCLADRHASAIVLREQDVGQTAQSQNFWKSGAVGRGLGAQPVIVNRQIGE